MLFARLERQTPPSRQSGTGPRLVRRLGGSGWCLFPYRYNGQQDPGGGVGAKRHTGDGEPKSIWMLSKESGEEGRFPGPGRTRDDNEGLASGCCSFKFQ